jgi:hypothetical protein
MLALTVTACVSEGNGVAPAASEASNVNLGTFDCGEGESLTISRAGTALLVSDSQDDSAELAPSPPGQNARYDAEGYALALDGDEALWMKAGQEPMTCRL